MSAHHRHFAGIFIMSMLPALSSGCGRKAGASSDGDLPQPVQDLPQGLVIPDGSPMRTRVKVEAIASRPVHHELNVPATAEADPAKMAKISPPLPGRVVKLLVRLARR